MSLIDDLAVTIAATTGLPFQPVHQQQASGGCINQNLILSGHCGRRFFIKLNRADHLDAFEAEADGLHELAQTQALRVPRALGWGTHRDKAWLILEYLPLTPHGDAVALGHGLATLHRNIHTHFGWKRDNFIGNTPQPNAWSTDWVDFWREQRLGHQLALARHDGAPARLLSACADVAAALPELFADYRPVASLLHGDLWGGNTAFCDRAPCLFDPASYYGDRETDIAMTELFGGFSPAFYAAYQASWPLKPGYPLRRKLYNLYHILNHHHLFGGSYAQQAESLCQQILAEILAGTP